jgi:simple sugar transport system ATP-binding protein
MRTPTGNTSNTTTVVMAEQEITNSSDTGQPVIAMHGITKSYGQVQALRGVDLELWAGEIHALVGDNGAGKSTLLKVIAGVVKPDSGEMRLHGRPFVSSSPAQARDSGIETVYQDLALAEDRSCTANVYMGRELKCRPPLGWLGWLDRREMHRRTRASFAELSVPIEQVERSVRLLSGGQRQGVAIARGAIWAKHVLLLDEPTAALGVRQRGAVEALTDRLRRSGLAILLISHDVPEVLKLADRVTVLRLGKRVATRWCHEVDTNWVVTSMVGGEEEGR